MTGLADEIIATEQRLALLRRQAAYATCAELGRHDMQSIGGMNCAGAGGAGDCSVAVCECSRCGACDYGFSDESRAQIDKCGCVR